MMDWNPDDMFDSDWITTDHEAYDEWLSAMTDNDPRWPEIRMYPTWRDKLDALTEKYGIALFVLASAGVILVLRMILSSPTLLKWAIDWTFGYSKGRK